MKLGQATGSLLHSASAPVHASQSDDRPLPRLPANQSGFIVNPVAATLFVGLVLTIVVYSTLDLTGSLTRLGRAGPILPLIGIACLMIGIYRGAKHLKRRSARIRVKGPLFMRSLMNDCIERTYGRLQRLLDAPEMSSAMILNDILRDKILYICATDCLRFSDIRRQIESSRLKGSDDLVLARLFQTSIAYRKQELPGEIRQVAETVARSRPDLKTHLERLKNAHQTLCTGTGNILALLPPDAKKVAKIRATYRYRPPTPQRAQRMAFALEALAYLRATRHENVNPLDRRRYDAVATQVIPKLADALKRYQQAWQELVDAYETPQSERTG